MAFVHGELVLETTTTTGTGTLTLAGAVSGHRTFAAGIGEGNTCAYSIEASNGQKETGIGTVGSGTLARTTLKASSTGSKLDLPAGTHYVGVSANSESFTPAAIGAATTATKLDDFAAPDNNTDLDASTSAHGLVVKATAPAAGIRNVVAIDNGETAYKNTALFDTTNPAALGTAAPGTSLIAARRDHVHEAPAAGDWDGDIADINLDGGTDIGAALADADLILVDDGANGTNRKSALSRVWTYILAKITAGISPYLTGYTLQGKATADTTTDHYTSGTTTLSIPLDGRVYDFDFPANNITIAFSGAPTAPVCADTVINFKQRASSTMYGFTSWPSGIKWASGTPPTMTQTLSARLKVVVSTSPAGLVDGLAISQGV